MTVRKELEALAREQRALEMVEIKLLRAELGKELRRLHKEYGSGSRLPKLVIKKEFADGDYYDALGLCNLAGEYIHINYRRCIEWDINPKEVLEHEYAHYITSPYDNEMHGVQWKLNCKWIGHDYEKHKYPEITVEYISD